MGRVESNSTPVTDDVMDAFRAYLSGDTEEWKVRNDALDRSLPARRAYKAFLMAMFTEAVDRRLGRSPSWERIVEFVAELRARDDSIADMIDPDEAERMIAWASDDETGSGDIDERRSVGIWMFVIAAVVRDAGLDAAGLDAFLRKSRRFAHQVLG